MGEFLRLLITRLLFIMIKVLVLCKKNSRGSRTNWLFLIINGLSVNVDKTDIIIFGRKQVIKP